MKKTVALCLVLAILVIFPPLSLAQDSTTSPGQIAYIGTDYNVYTVSPQGGTPTALSNDANLSRTAPRIYQWPTWSPDGQLAYFGASLNTAGNVVTDVMIAPDAHTPGISAATLDDTSLTYANWSTHSCGEDCHDLALLVSDSAGLAVRLVRWQNGAATSTTVGTGAPFYYSWSPDGARMIWQRDNQKFDIYDTASSSITQTLTQTPGAMFTPAWSPVDDRLLLGVRNQSSTDLVVASDDKTTTLAAGLPNPIWFSWSPDGTQVAYIDRQGPLMVLDAASGATITRSPVSGVGAFFWSPDSQHIAYVTVASDPASFDAAAPADIKIAAPMPQTASGLSWSILDVADGAVRRYGSFLPTNDLVYLLTYFDQFSVSHHLWSPDSRQIVYSEITPDQRSVITLLDTTQDSTVPLVIADGTIGIWSFS